MAVIQLPEFGSEAALEFAGRELAELFTAESVTGAQVQAKLAMLGQGVVGWSKLGKSYHRAKALITAHDAAVQATAALAEIAAREQAAA